MHRIYIDATPKAVGIVHFDNLERTEITIPLEGDFTCNGAEYQALILALEYCEKLDGRIHIYSDSELLVKQMRGSYRVKSADIRRFYDIAIRMANNVPGLEYIKHIRGRDNPADALTRPPKKCKKKSSNK